MRMYMALEMHSLGHFVEAWKVGNKNATDCIIISLSEFPSYLLSDFYIINILDCSEDEECTGLSDTCNSRICMCGVSPTCSNQTSDACESGKCRCGSNLECKGTFCISGVCRQGTF